MYSSSFNPYQGFPGYGKSRGKGIKGRPTLGYEDKVLNRNYEGEGANQWKDERIRPVAATCCLHVVALIALPKPVRDVCECTFGWPPRQLDGVRIVPIRHSLRFLVCWHGGRRLSVAMGNLSLKYIYPSFNQMLGSMSPLITVLLAVVMQQKHFPLKTWLSMPVICVGCSLQREGAQLQCARCVLRQRSYRASSGEISHSRKAPVHPHQMDSASCHQHGSRFRFEFARWLWPEF
mmetsp:Transcript_181/g.419  ORF Transcript_181/g.419 Transcript_181/m.419 type:complete len:234 (+) Transcript_181:55-756(+)